MKRKALITGLAGLHLGRDEARFLERQRPAGVIVFKRNIDTPQQLSALIAAARIAIGAGSDVLVLVDQEGGKVQRLCPPHWRSLPAAASFASRYAGAPSASETAIRQATLLAAHDLKAVGINVNCVPCLDVPVSGSHDVIGTRAYGSDVATIIRLARLVAESSVAMGVLPVMKHIPGHGRAAVDSHWAVPVVSTPRDELSRTDFATFRALRHLPAAMTGHVVYAAIDELRPATLSAPVIADIVRGEIGFDGLLMTDDLAMHALQGTMTDRANGAIRAGCDIALHCNGNLAEMEAVAAGVPWLEDDALRRFQACVSVATREAYPLDIAAAETLLADHMTAVADSGDRLA